MEDRPGRTQHGVSEPGFAENLRDAPEPGDTYVHSFAKGLAVIRAFGAEAPQQTLTEVATRAGVTRAGARRILLTLQHLGYVRSDGRAFSLTPKILELGFAYLSSLPLTDMATPVLEALVSEVQETVSMAVLDGNEVVFVLRVAAPKIIGSNLHVGSRLPAYNTAHGRMLLASLTTEELRARLTAQAPLSARTSRTVTNVETLIELVEQARRQGWCLVNQEMEEGLISLAAPVIDRRGQIVATVNIASQYSRTPPKHMRDLFTPSLLMAAKSVSRMLQMRG